MISRELTAASTEPIVLSILAGGDSYGYDIIQRVKTLSDDRIEWAEGALYPVLHRLEHQGLVSSYWEVSAEGRRRKYYRLTSHGKEALVKERSQWRLVTEVLSQLWKPASQTA